MVAPRGRGPSVYADDDHSRGLWHLLAAHRRESLLGAGSRFINAITESMNTSLNGGIMPFAVLSNPFPNGIVTPPQRNGDPNVALYGQGITYADYRQSSGLRPANGMVIFKSNSGPVSSSTPPTPAPKERTFATDAIAELSAGTVAVAWQFSDANGGQSLPGKSSGYLPI
jgi:hypothetical protein